MAGPSFNIRYGEATSYGTALETRNIVVIAIIIRIEKDPKKNKER